MFVDGMMAKLAVIYLYVEIEGRSYKTLKWRNLHTILVSKTKENIRATAIEHCFCLNVCVPPDSYVET